MKNFRTAMLCVCIALCSLCSSAQKQDQSIPFNKPNYNKPKLFINLPDSISISVDNLNSLFNTQLGRASSLNLSDNSTFRFEGQVMSTSSKYGNTIKSVVIRSTNYNGATLTISKTMNADGTISYSGRIISFQSGDLFELQNKDGHLTLVKRNFYDLVNE